MRTRVKQRLTPVNDFLRKVFKQDGITPPTSCAKSFKTNFEHAINTEWSKRGGSYEAIFYKENIEHIALFEKNGTLKKYKMMLSEELLPVSIKNELESEGEIMSVVLINEGNSINYEVILRNPGLQRFLVKVDHLGKKVMEEKL